jgi:hypothetical protein
MAGRGVRIRLSLGGGAAPPPVPPGDAHASNPVATKPQGLTRESARPSRQFESLDSKPKQAKHLRSSEALAPVTPPSASTLHFGQPVRCFGFGYDCGRIGSAATRIDEHQRGRLGQSSRSEDSAGAWMRRRSVHWEVGRPMDAAICHPSQVLDVRVPIPTFLSPTQGILAGAHVCLSAT